MVGRVLQWDFLAWKLIQRTTPKSAEGWLMSPSRSPPVGYGSLTPTDSSIEEALKRGNAWITVAWNVCLLCLEPLRGSYNELIVFHMQCKVKREGKVNSICAEVICT